MAAIHALDTSCTVIALLPTLNRWRALHDSPVFWPRLETLCIWARFFLLSICDLTSGEVVEALCVEATFFSHAFRPMDGPLLQLRWRFQASW